MKQCSGTRGVREGGVEAPTLWKTLARYVLWNLGDKMEGSWSGITPFRE